jgi:hypothetical protein
VCKGEPVDIDLLGHKEIERVLKYLEYNKADGANSIVAELLKNGGLNLVDTLHEVIQQAWNNEIQPRSWTEEVFCPVNKKGDKLDCKNYRGIGFLNVTYKVVTSPKFYATTFYPLKRDCSAIPGWVPIG